MLLTTRASARLCARHVAGSGPLGTTGASRGQGGGGGNPLAGQMEEEGGEALLAAVSGRLAP